MKKPFLNQMMLLLVMLILVATVDAQSKTPGKNYQADESSGQATINYKDGQQQYKIRMSGDKIIELYVDDKKIAEENYNKYEEAINRILIQIKKDKEAAELDRQHALVNQQQAKLSMEQAQQYKQQAEQDALQANKFKLKAELDKQNAMTDMKRAQQEQVMAKQNQDKAMIDAKHAEEDKQTVTDLLSDLEKENIIDDSKKVASVELNEETFTVNGKKQSEELHNKFKQKYLKKKGTKINYNYRNFSISNE